VAGHIPIRGKGNGTAPIEGWLKQNDWRGTINFFHLPAELNPPQKIFVSANNNVATNNNSYFFGSDWAMPYRNSRITSVLTSNTTLSIEDHKKLQGDVLSLQSRETLPHLLTMLSPTTEIEKRAVKILREWNGDMGSESPAAAIYAMWLSKIPVTIAADEIGIGLSHRYNHSAFLLKVIAEETRSLRWCDNIQTIQKETCDDAIQSAFSEALFELQERMGSDVTKWQWGNLSQMTFSHRSFGTTVPLKPLFNRVIGNSGDRNTVNVGGTDLQNPSVQRFGPMYRQIITFSEHSESLFVISTGQSGHFLSSHYDDFLTDWQNVQYRTMRYKRNIVEEVVEGRLILRNHQGL
jgi:penicillin amidase